MSFDPDSDPIPHGLTQLSIPTVHAFQNRVSLFKYLSPVECRVMAELTERRSYADGEVIQREGEPASGLHIVDKGEVEVSQRDFMGRDKLVTTIIAQEHFGETSILSNPIATATVTARGPVEVLVMSQTVFTNLLHRSESFGVRLLRALCEDLSNRLREAREQLVRS